MGKLYNSDSKNYYNDEDNRQTSAWYVFPAMGFYPVYPGVLEYATGSPLFPKLTLHLPHGENLIARVKGNSSTSCYAGKVLFNDSKFTHSFLTHRELISGRGPVLSTDSMPDLRRGTLKTDLPYSCSRGH